MMRKLLKMMLASAMALILAACGSGDSSSDEEKTYIIATDKHIHHLKWKMKMVI